jgi:hypothetical protein
MEVESIRSAGIELAKLMDREGVVAEVFFVLSFASATVAQMSPLVWL